MKPSNAARLFARHPLDITTPAQMKAQVGPTLSALTLHAFITLRLPVPKNPERLERGVEALVDVLATYTHGAWVLEFLDFETRRVQEVHLRALVGLRKETSREHFLERLGASIAQAPVSFSVLNYEAGRGWQYYLNIITRPCALLGWPLLKTDHEAYTSSSPAPAPCGTDAGFTRQLHPVDSDPELPSGGHTQEIHTPTTQTSRSDRPALQCAVDYRREWKTFVVHMLDRSGASIDELSLHESDLTHLIASLSAAAVFFRARVSGAHASRFRPDGRDHESS
jgi:hypothetical protein